MMERCERKYIGSRNAMRSSVAKRVYGNEGGRRERERLKAFRSCYGLLATFNGGFDLNLYKAPETG